MTTTPPLGLMLDVDGPIASPETRTISRPEIIDHLLTLAEAGVPIAFITGRSEAFIRGEVVAPMLDAGIAPNARMYGVCEKGAVWFEITAAGIGEVSVDESVQLPPGAVTALRALVEERYSDSMFFDETKRGMVSVEQRTDVSNEAYRAAQSQFDTDAFELLATQGLGVRHGDREAPDADGRVPYRLDSTIISTDIESVTLDKSHAAERTVAHFASTGPLPELWRTVGDSRGDYLMADHLHGAGYEVAHVDVRPSDGILDRPYRVIVEGDKVHDDAGAAFLRHWVEKIAGG